jgi:cell division protein FtsW
MKTARQLEILLFSLLAVGMIYIFNSSIIHSQNVFGDPHRFFVLHAGWTFLGLVAYALFKKIQLKTLISYSTLLYFSCVGLLVFLALWGILPCSMSTTFVPCINSANRWLVVNPAPLPKVPFIGEISFQPAELAKIALILFLTSKLKQYSGKSKNYQGFKAYMLYTGLFAFLVLLQPNMSTALLFFGIGTAMYMISGQSIKPFYYVAPIILAAAVLLILLSPYRRERLFTFVNHTQTNSDTQEGYQVKQVKIALGSGGLFGVGFGNSRQKYTYLPEVSTDSIFAVVGEEFGWIGSVAILGIFLSLILKGLEVAKESTEMTHKLTATGITCWLGLQVLIHLSANAGLIPYTGVPLPFISYGGSSLIFSMVSMGILVGISRSNDSIQIAKPRKSQNSLRKALAVK